MTDEQITLIDEIVLGLKDLYEMCTYPPGDERLAYLNGIHDALQEIKKVVEKNKS